MSGINGWKWLDSQLMGVRRGVAAYRGQETVVAALSPIVAPAVQQILAKNGMPMSAQGAIVTLAKAANDPTSVTGLEQSGVMMLSQYVAGHIGSGTLAKTTISLAGALGVTGGVGPDGL